MKKLKTLISVVLSAMLVLSLVVPSMADTTAGSISIRGKAGQEEGETYTAYQIFKLDYLGTKGVYTATDDAITALGNVSAYGITFSGDKDLANLRYVEIDQTKFKAADFAKYLKGLGADKLSKFASNSATTAYNNNEEKIPVATIDVSALGAGYYFVDTTVGTVCALDNTTPNMQVEDKNEDITVDKVIVENNSTTDENSVQIGDVVQFKTTINIPEGNEKVVLHDTMEAGFTFNNNIAIDGLTLGTDYTVNVATEEEPFADGCTFEIVFKDTWLKGEAKVVVVTYSATLNENAEVLTNINDSQNVNQNQTKVTYGANQESNIDYTKTTTAQFKLYKVNKETQELLAGAKFNLKQDGNVVNLHRISATQYKVVKEKISDSDNIITSITDGDGIITILGLDKDLTYTLEEIEAPEGFNKINGNINFGLFATEKVENTTGSLLPDTGSTGTKVLFTVGGIMMVVAFVLFTSKRRMAAED